MAFCNLKELKKKKQTHRQVHFKLQIHSQAVDQGTWPKQPNELLGNFYYLTKREVSG